MSDEIEIADLLSRSLRRSASEVDPPDDLLARVARRRRQRARRTHALLGTVLILVLAGVTTLLVTRHENRTGVEVTPPPTTSPTTTPLADSPTTVLAQGADETHRLVVTAAGPPHTRLHLWITEGRGGPTCEMIAATNPGISLGGGKPAYMPGPSCQHPIDVPTDGWINGRLWVAPDHQLWGLYCGRAVGAHRLEIRWRRYSTTVPVRDGWWVAALPDADNGGGTVYTPISSTGKRGQPFTDG